MRKFEASWFTGEIWNLIKKNNPKQLINFFKEHGNAIANLNLSDPNSNNNNSNISQKTLLLNIPPYELKLTFLQYSIEKNLTEIVKILIENDVDINFSKGKEYLPPLHLAVKSRRDTIVSLLVACPSIDLLKKDLKGDLALYYVSVDDADELIPVSFFDFSVSHIKNKNEPSIENIIKTIINQYITNKTEIPYESITSNIYFYDTSDIKDIKDIAKNNTYQNVERVIKQILLILPSSAFFQHQYLVYKIYKDGIKNAPDIIRTRQDFFKMNENLLNRLKLSAAKRCIELLWEKPNYFDNGKEILFEILKNEEQANTWIKSLTIQSPLDWNIYRTMNVAELYLPLILENNVNKLKEQNVSILDCYMALIGADWEKGNLSKDQATDQQIKIINNIFEYLTAYEQEPYKIRLTIASCCKNYLDKEIKGQDLSIISALIDKVEISSMFYLDLRYFLVQLYFVVSNTKADKYGKNIIEKEFNNTTLDPLFPWLKYCFLHIYEKNISSEERELEIIELMAMVLSLKPDTVHFEDIPSIQRKAKEILHQYANSKFESVREEAKEIIKKAGKINVSDATFISPNQASAPLPGDDTIIAIYEENMGYPEPINSTTQIVKSLHSIQDQNLQQREQELNKKAEMLKRWEIELATKAFDNRKGPRPSDIKTEKEKRQERYNKLMGIEKKPKTDEKKQSKTITIKNEKGEVEGKLPLYDKSEKYKTSHY